MDITTGKKEIIDLLRQRSRPYLFSNSIPPMVAAAGVRMFEMMDESHALQDKLHRNTAYFVERMKAAGFDIKPTESAICAVMLYDAKVAQEMSHGCSMKAFTSSVFTIRSCRKSRRIRVQISAAHETAHLDACIKAFTQVAKQMNIL